MYVYQYFEVLLLGKAPIREGGGLIGSFEQFASDGSRDCRNRAHQAHATKMKNGPLYVAIFISAAGIARSVAMK